MRKTITEQKTDNECLCRNWIIDPDIQLQIHTHTHASRGELVS